MHFEVFVEEPSALAALENLLPRMLGMEHTFRPHAFQDKNDLFSNLPKRLKGYSRWLPADWKILVLVDEDRKNCHTLKRNLEKAAVDAGLASKTAATGKRFQVVNRIVIEELEAWFFGDVPALCAVFPNVPVALDQKAAYRNPDAIKGGTWEALHKVLKKAGYFPDYFPKVEVARAVSKHMDPARNRSHSFNVFRQAVLACQQ